jgi:hypothetical protein
MGREALSISNLASSGQRYLALAGFSPSLLAAQHTEKWEYPTGITTFQAYCSGFFNQFDN